MGRVSRILKQPPTDNLADVDPELNQLTGGHLALREELFACCFRELRQSARCADFGSPESFAATLMVAYQGLCIANRMGAPRDELRRTVAPTLIVLRLPA